MTENPRFVQPSFETHGDMTPEVTARVHAAFVKAALALETEWKVDAPSPVTMVVMDNKTFRGLATGPNDPVLWKFCFLMCDPPQNRVYINTDLFSTLPHDAEAMVKHETAHIVPWHLVGSKDAYHSSYFLAEGTAGLDGATERLVRKIRRENISDVPDPLQLQSEKQSKAAGGDTNHEPFTEQLGELVIASAVEFLRRRHGEQKVLQLYRNMRPGKTLEEAYREVCGESLRDVFAEWRSSLDVTK